MPLLKPIGCVVDGDTLTFWASITSPYAGQYILSYFELADPNYYLGQQADLDDKGYIDRYGIEHSSNCVPEDAVGIYATYRIRKSFPVGEGYQPFVRLQLRENVSRCGATGIEISTLEGYIQNLSWDGSKIVGGCSIVEKPCSPSCSIETTVSNKEPEVGEVITVTSVVKNTGDCDLWGIFSIILDQYTVLKEIRDLSLKPGETYELTANYEVEAGAHDLRGYASFSPSTTCEKAEVIYPKSVGKILTIWNRAYIGQSSVKFSFKYTGELRKAILHFKKEYAVLGGTNILTLNGNEIYNKTGWIVDIVEDIDITSYINNGENLLEYRTTIFGRDDRVTVSIEVDVDGTIQEFKIIGTKPICDLYDLLTGKCSITEFGIVKTALLAGGFIFLMYFLMLALRPGATIIVTERAVTAGKEKAKGVLP